MSDRGAWHGDQAFKDRIVALLTADHDADRLAQGIYLSLFDTEQGQLTFRGCMIGCLFMAHLRDTNPDPDRPVAAIAHQNRLNAPSWHDQAPKVLGIPRDMAELWDVIFEWVPSDTAPIFAVDSLSLVAPGADLSKVPARLAHELVNDTHWGLGRWVPRNMRLTASELNVLLYHLATDGVLPSHNVALKLKNRFHEGGAGHDDDDFLAAQQLAEAAYQLMYPRNTFTVFTLIRHLLEAARFLILPTPDTGLELWTGYQSWVLERLYKLSQAAPKIRQS